MRITKDSLQHYCSFDSTSEHNVEQCKSSNYTLLTQESGYKLVVSGNTEQLYFKDKQVKPKPSVLSDSSMSSRT